MSSYCLNKNGQLKTISLTFLPEVIYSPGTHEADYLFLLPFYYNYEQINHLIPEKYTRSNLLVNSFMALTREIDGESIFRNQALKVGLYNLLFHVLTYYEELLNTYPLVLKDQYHLKRLKDVFDFIQENYVRQIHLDEIADVSKLSKTYLCKYFKRITGRSVNDYIVRCRLNEAKRLLIYTKLPISQIAYSCGFNSHSYFNRAFIKVFHQSPSLFRDAHRS